MRARPGYIGSSSQSGWPDVSFVFEGRFPRQNHDVPGAVIVHVANQVNVPADLYPRYEWSGRTIEYHRAQIREFLGFHEATVQDGAELVTWLAERILPQEPREDHVREAMFERCRALRIEPPSAGRIDGIATGPGRSSLSSTRPGGRSSPLTPVVSIY